MMTSDALRRAVAIAGGTTALARRIGISPSYMSQMVSGERPVPVERCADIESAIDGGITRRDLRPEDWWRIWPELVTAEFPIPTPATEESATS